MQLTREELLKIGLLGGAGLVVPLTYAATTQAQALDRLPASRIPAPFQVPLAIPPIARPVRRDAGNDYYQMTMKRAFVPILPGFPRTEIFGYDGITPGPTIVAVTGTERGSSPHQPAAPHQSFRSPQRHLGPPAWHGIGTPRMTDGPTT